MLQLSPQLLLPVVLFQLQLVCGLILLSGLLLQGVVILGMLCGALLFQIQVELLLQIQGGLPQLLLLREQVFLNFLTRISLTKLLSAQVQLLLLLRVAFSMRLCEQTRHLPLTWRFLPLPRFALIQQPLA